MCISHPRCTFGRLRIQEGRASARYGPSRRCCVQPCGAEHDNRWPRTAIARHRCVRLGISLGGVDALWLRPRQQAGDRSDVNAVLRVATVACLLLAVILVVSLHMVSELDPVVRRLSEYATGPGGLLMTTAFFLIGVGLISSGGLFIRNGGALPGVALVLAGIGMLLAGVYPTDPDSATAAEEIHSTGSAVATGLVVLASLRVSFTGHRRSATMRLVAGAGLLLALASVVLHDTSVSGLSQRLLWMTLLWWVVLATWFVSTTDSELP
jgi:hypothetical protein